jgi:hypothetical protein
MIPLRRLSREEVQRLRVDELRPICHKDLMDAAVNIKASSKPTTINKLKEFAAKFA